MSGNNSFASQAQSPDLSLMYFDPVTLTSVHPRDMAQYPERNLIPIDQAFEQALSEMQRLDSDPALTRKKDWIGRHLSTLEDKVRDINLNYAEISEAIKEAAESAEKRLQAMTRTKLDSCLSMEVELRRELEQLDW